MYRHRSLSEQQLACFKEKQENARLLGTNEMVQNGSGDAVILFFFLLTDCAFSYTIRSLSEILHCLLSVILHQPISPVVVCKTSAGLYCIYMN